MEKQVLAKTMKQFLRGIFKDSDLTVGDDMVKFRYTIHQLE